MWPAAGWHTTSACQYWKQKLGKAEFLRPFDHIFLSSTMTEPDAMALGAAQNYIEQMLESEVGNPNMYAYMFAYMYAYSQLLEMRSNRYREMERELQELREIDGIVTNRLREQTREIREFFGRDKGVSR
jgi:hypothetical protein